MLLPSHLFIHINCYQFLPWALEAVTDVPAVDFVEYWSTAAFCLRRYCNRREREMSVIVAIRNWLELKRDGGICRYSPVVTMCTTRFNSHKCNIMPTQCIYVFCVDLRTNSTNYSPRRTASNDSGTEYSRHESKEEVDNYFHESTKLQYRHKHT